MTHAVKTQMDAKIKDLKNLEVQDSVLSIYQRMEINKQMRWVKMYNG